MVKKGLWLPDKGKEERGEMGREGWITYECQENFGG